MKKQIAVLLALSLIFTFAGCRKSKKQNPAPTTPVVQTPSTSSPMPTTPSAPSSGTIETMIAVDVGFTIENTTASDGTVIFQRTNQKMHLTLNNPEIAEKITNNFLNRLDITEEADAVASAAKSAYTGSSHWIRYFYGLAYNPQRIDQKVLSFYGDNVRYFGAAHAEISRKGANYDLATGDVLTLASIMTTTATTNDFCALVLAGLADRAEGDFLREGYSEDVKRRFTVDASQDESWYFTTTGLCFYFDPYEIAPYSSGVVTVEIPYAKLQGLLHPDYFPAEQAYATGKVVISDFTVDLANKFPHTAELIMNPEGKMYLVHPEGNVRDIRITFTDTTGTYTVFAANSLSAGEAILIQATTETAKTLELSYQSNSKVTSITIAK